MLISPFRMLWEGRNLWNRARNYIPAKNVSNSSGHSWEGSFLRSISFRVTSRESAPFRTMLRDLPLLHFQNFFQRWLFLVLLFFGKQTCPLASPSLLCPVKAEPGPIDWICFPLFACNVICTCQNTASQRSQVPWYASLWQPCLALAGELGHKGEKLGIRHCPSPVSMGEAGLVPRESLSKGTCLEGKLN